MTVAELKATAAGSKVKSSQTATIFTVAFNDGVSFDLISDASGKHLMTFANTPAPTHTIGFANQPALVAKIAASLEVL